MRVVRFDDRDVLAVVELLQTMTALLRSPTALDDPGLRERVAARCAAYAEGLDHLVGRAVSAEIDTATRGPFDQDEEGDNDEPR